MAKGRSSIAIKAAYARSHAPNKTSHLPATCDQLVNHPSLVNPATGKPLKVKCGARSYIGFNNGPKHEQPHGYKHVCYDHYINPPKTAAETKREKENALLRTLGLTW